MTESRERAPTEAAGGTHDRPGVEPLEEVVVFGSRGPLVGVETLPPARAASGDNPAFIVLNSGMLHRVGPSRLSVQLARRLAHAGFTCLRFDHSGVGESPPARDGRLVTQRWSDEVSEAIDHLAASRGVRTAVVMGNCSGAAGSYLAAQTDPRIVGAGLLNPSGPTPIGYYLRLVRSKPAFWRRLLRGRFKLHILRQNAQRRTESPEKAPSRDEVVESLIGIANRGTRILVLSCEWDPSYDRIQVGMRSEVERRAPAGQIEFHVVRGSNHMFSLLRHQEEMLRIVLGWAGGFRAP